MLFENTTANIATAFQVCNLGGNLTGVDVWAAEDVQVFFHRFKTGKCVQEREGETAKEYS